MDEHLVARMVDEIKSYVCSDVNFIEAAALYMEKHHIDAETFANIIKSNPVLWSNIYETGVKTRNIKQTQSMLFFL